MEQPRQYLIDSNAVIDYLGKKMPKAGLDLLSAVMDSTPQVSVITKVEVLGYNAPQDSEQLLKSFMDDVVVIGLTDEIITQTIAIRKTHKIKLPDAFVAATAIVFNLTLVTRNAIDFKMIKNLALIDPWTL
jgi:predicted nucleic acid-binding protein